MYDNQFYEYASMLLIEAGHMITPNPIYANHTSSETLYIDSNKDVVIPSIDRALLSTINNVSLLFEVEWEGVVEELTEKVQVYSITVDFFDSSRSQNIADIHYLLQQYWSCNHSIIFFKNRNQFVVSFADAARSHILSDWLDISEDCDSLIERLSIANMSLDTCDGYFEDFVYALAREYYNYPISFEEASYGMMPIDLLFPKFASFANYVPDDEVTKEDIKDVIRENLSYYEKLYGYDYVAIRYEGIGEATSYRNLTDEIERISFELDFEEEYGEETSEIYNFGDEDDYIEEDDDFLEELDDDFDSAIFDDPVLMVKWLEGKQKQADEQDNTVEEERRQKRLEAERKERERIEAERREQERLEAERRERERNEAERREQERLEAERRERERIEAERREQERLEAERRERERIEAERREQERLEAERRERERIEAERREQERLELVRKERESREQERLETERREREWLENDIREQELWLNIQKEHKRREAERREQERLEAERKERERIEAERREQERLEAERRERERIEAERRKKEERRQRELDELSQNHSAELSAIKLKYESELSVVTSEIATIKRRLLEIEDRIPKLNFLQFGEKKNLKAEQESLTERLAKLNSLTQEMKKHFEREMNIENQRYSEILRDLEIRYE